MKKIYAAILFLLFWGTVYAVLPTTPSSNLSTGNVEGNSIYFYFTKGNGTSRIAILKMGSPVTAVPQNGNSYLASLTFGNGQELAPGEFVVYNGSGSSFGVNNLIPETDYYIAIYEVNGSGLTSEFLTTSFLNESVSTLYAPTIQPTNISISEITGNTMKLTWAAGDGVNRIVLAKEGAPVNANPVELLSYRANDRVEYRGSNSGSVIGDNNFVVYKGAGTSVDLSEMNPDTTYHFAVFEYNGSSGPVYLTTNPLRGSAKTLPQPTIPSSNIVASQIEADRFSLRWTAGNGTRRIVVVREGAPIDAFPQNNVNYGADARFNLAPEIAPGHKVVYDNVNNNVTVTNLTLGSTYYIAVFEYSGGGSIRGYLTSEYASLTQATQPVPSINVTNIDTSSITAYNAQLTFTPGNGTGRLIVVKQDTPVDFVPNNYQNYNSNATYGSTYGNLGNGNYAVYKGTASTASLNLQPNTKYYVAAFEYNGINYPAFNITDVDTFSFTTKLPPSPTVPSKFLVIQGVEGNSMQLVWTRGDGERRMVIVRKGSPVDAVPVNGVQYTGNKAFNLADEVEPGQKVIYDGTGNNTYVDSLEIGTTYHVKVIEYNGTGNITSYLMAETLSGSRATLYAPTVSASEVYFELLTLDKLRIFWRQGSGSRRIILGRKNAPVDGVPEDLKTYSASTNFGGGSKIGENSVVFNYTYYGRYGDQYQDTLYTDVSSMEAGNTYYFKIFEYNGVSGPVYKKTDPALASFKITFEPPTPATNFRSTSSDGNTLALQWTIGGGDKRVIVAREGQPVDVVPQDGIDYAENKDFRLAPEIAPGQRVVYDGASYFTNPEGLNPNTEYFFKIFEYGGTGANMDYLTSAFDSTIASTKSAPTIQASNLVVSAITPESGNVSWTNGDGERRIAVAKKGSPVTIDPKDTTTYSANYFGRAASHLGDGNYVVYKNTANNFQMLQLESGTTYHLAVYEFNGNTGPVILRPPATGQFTTLGPPQENAIIGETTEITSNSFHINFTVGSGQKRLIVMREGSPVDAQPVDDVNYIDNTFLGAGDEIGTGNFVVYDGEDDNVIITGLNPGTVYYFTVFEYNAFSGGTIINYLRPSTALGMVTTDIENRNPVLTEIGNQSIGEQETLIFTAEATDVDVPAQNLTFSLDAASVILGMTIDPTTGEFSWIPTESQGGADYEVTITVTDDGTNPDNLSDSKTFTITVNEVNVAPELAIIGNQIVDELSNFAFAA
ncbi:MAG: hypothetical protein JXP36_16435, partial [Bacteroidales bacterium]|nr:hypothetical protein [Bacteroidales bacterium]